MFFECTVKANPWVNEVKWRFEGYPLYGNTSAGIIISNYSLVLQKVRKDHRGNYQCAATNSEGEGRSEEVMLKVKCEFYIMCFFFLFFFLVLTYKLLRSSPFYLFYVH